MENQIFMQMADIGDVLTAAAGADQIRPEIESYRAQAADYLHDQQFVKAAASLGRLANLLAKQKSSAEGARIRYAQARCYAKSPHHAEESRQACHAALSLSEKVGDRHLRATVCLFIAQLELAHENFASAYEALGQAIEVYEMLETEPAKLSRSYFLHGVIGTLLLEFERSERDFVSALALAKLLGGESSVLKVQALRAMTAVFSKGHISADLLSRLLTSATDSDQKEITAVKFLQTALDQLQLDKVNVARNLAKISLEKGEQVPTADGYVRYLIASLVLAEVLAAEDETVSVLAVLHRCRLYLERRYKRKIGPFIDLYLAGLRQRWGDDKMGQAVLGYQKVASTQTF